jgi:predicted RND superfamily exporter protein
MADRRQEDLDKAALYRALVEIVARAPVTTERVAIAGRPVLESEMGDIAKRDLAVMLPLVIIVAAAVLWLALRSARGVVLPLTVVVASVLWALGAMAWTNATFFTFNVIMPIILIPIGIADGIHVIDHFLRLAGAEPDRPAAELTFETMEDMAAPVILTSITTAVGLASLMISDIESIRVLGAYSAFGVLFAMIFSLSFLPAVLAVLPVPRRAAVRIRRKTTERHGILPAALDGVGRWVLRHPRLPVYAAVLIVLAGAASIPRVSIDASLVRNFPADNPVRVGDELIRKKFGGSTPVEIVIEAENDDAWKAPERLRALSALQDRLEASGLAAETRSLADFIKRMNQVMNPEDPHAYEIPDSRELVAQYLLLYSISGEPDDLDDVIDYGYRTANLRMQAVTDSSADLRAVFDMVDADARELLEPLGLVTRGSGVGSVMNAFMRLIVRSQTLSLAIAVVLIVVVSAMLFRSVPLGLIAAVPVVIATIVNFAVLGWFSVPLGVTTAMCSSVGIGIGVDFAIHFISRYRRAHALGETPEGAMASTVAGAGTAILYNALVVVAGFLVLSTSDFLPNQTFGWLISLVMVVCLVTTLTTMASLLHGHTVRTSLARESENARNDRDVISA